MTDYADGFITDPVLLAQSRIAPSSPNAFFTELLGRPYLKQIVVAPHVFPSALTQEANASRRQLFERFSKCCPPLP